MGLLRKGMRSAIEDLKIDPPAGIKKDTGSKPSVLVNSLAQLLSSMPYGLFFICFIKPISDQADFSLLITITPLLEEFC